MVNAVPFDDQAYWHERFEHERHFEWLLSWQGLQQYIVPYLDHPDEPILHLGCGNSRLAFELADHGYSHVVNVDYASNVIDFMKSQTDPNRYPHVEWYHGDCLKDLSSFARPDGYTVVIDKSLRDCIACGDDDQLSVQRQLCQQILSVTRPGGLWISISFSSEREFAWPDSISAPFVWKRVQTIPVKVQQVNERPGMPAIYYSIHVCRKEAPD